MRTHIYLPRSFNTLSVLAIAFLVCLPGCFKTKVGQLTMGVTHQERHWFTAGGLVGLSSPSGQQCSSGSLSYVESGMQGMDILISLGLAIVGGGIGAAFCDSDASSANYSACISSAASLAPFLLASRTVNYQCANKASAQMPVTWHESKKLDVSPSSTLAKTDKELDLTLHRIPSKK